MNDYVHLDAFSPAIDTMKTDSVLAYLTEDCVLQAGNAEPVQGHEAIRDVFDQLYESIDSIRHDITDRFSRENYVVYRGTVSYGLPGGKALSVPFCDVFVMRERKIAEYSIYIDWHKLWGPT